MRKAQAFVAYRFDDQRLRAMRALQERHAKGKKSYKGKFYFDEAAAQHVVDFFERYLRHVKGRWAGQPFKLEGWQREILRELFGWKRQDGTRRYRTFYLEIPRKNGKSTIAAGIALYLLHADGEPAAEVYSAAADRDQAAIIFEMARGMTLASQALLRRSQIFKRSIVAPSSGSTYKVLSADANTKHGFSPHGIMFDELHTQPNRQLWEALTTGTGARRQPLTVAITTAGYDRNSVCWELHEYAVKVATCKAEDDAFLGVIFTTDEDDDWTDEKAWARANPNLGISVGLEFLRGEARKAEQTPTYENAFRQLFLNQWTSQKSRFLPMRAWDLSAGEVDPLEIKGVPGYAGLDLAATTDMTAFGFVAKVDEDFKVMPRFWIPEAKLRERIQRDQVPYDVWAKKGLVTITPGNVVDYRAMVRDIVDLREQGFDIREIGFDPWNATATVQELEAAGFKMVPIRQGFASMSGPTKELLTHVLAGHFHHGGHPVLRWNADNLEVARDPAGNVKPDKSQAKKRIDGLVACIMALDRALRNEGAEGPSVYETRGLVTA